MPVMTSYYTASSMKVAEIMTQQSFLKASIDSELAMLLKDRITNASSVFDCIDTYPL